MVRFDNDVKLSREPFANLGREGGRSGRGFDVMRAEVNGGALEVERASAMLR
jgi:hypothetical protein